MRYIILALSGFKTTVQLAWHFAVGGINAFVGHFASFGVDLAGAESQYKSALAVFHASGIASSVGTVNPISSGVAVAPAAPVVAPK